eukprot:CAMPEP_0197306514 /NCGR_PEP_ID=MMETSP0891-20130614/3478_1 /TAXON_ID=44058 ORGANISM="Aureoumbra lagunensis, Strain CCMP1510" /NCGR_SAMPLE_ID=MMETSP0891 /ASSEMBLY_ACC=CAM_ASM_000534 /LENGTH=677 /DNA_ID=CAMNT_0042788859 /DNA_START=36 /DNA_END=2066 /DNA_ORIENTATION=+
MRMVQLIFLIWFSLCARIAAVLVQTYEQLVSAIETGESYIQVIGNITWQDTIHIPESLNVIIETKDGDKPFFLERPAPRGGLDGWLHTVKSRQNRRKITELLTPSVLEDIDFIKEWTETSTLLNNYFNTAIRFDDTANSFLYDWLLQNFESIDSPDSSDYAWQPSTEMLRNEDDVFTPQWNSFQIADESEYDASNTYYYSDDQDGGKDKPHLSKASANLYPPLFIVTGGFLKLRNIRISGRQWTNIALPGILSGMGPHTTIEDSAAPFLVVKSGGSAVAENVEFADGLGRGASVAEISDSSTFNATKCLFRGNWGTRGAVAVTTKSSMLTDSCIFSRNVALWDGSGGAISVVNESTLDIIGSTRFRDNTAWIGGAVFVGYDSVLRATNASFTRNLAVWGGAIDLFHGSSATILSSKFIKNDALRLADESIFGQGGAICATDQSTLLVVNGIFRYNSVSSGRGAAIYSADDSVVYLASSIVEYNTAISSIKDETAPPCFKTGGGGLFLGTLSTFVLYEATIRFNIPEDLDASSDGTALLRGTINICTAKKTLMTSAVIALPDVDVDLIMLDKNSEKTADIQSLHGTAKSPDVSNNGAFKNFVANDAYVAEDLFKAGVRESRPTFVANDIFVAEDLYKAAGIRTIHTSRSSLISDRGTFQNQKQGGTQEPPSLLSAFIW